MKSCDFSVTSKLFLYDSGEELEEDDNVVVKTTDGSVLRGRIEEISSSEIDIELSGNIEGDITIEYEHIESIKKEEQKS